MSTSFSKKLLYLQNLIMFPIIFLDESFWNICNSDWDSVSSIRILMVQIILKSRIVIIHRGLKALTQLTARKTASDREAQSKDLLHGSARRASRQTGRHFYRPWPGRASACPGVGRDASGRARAGGPGTERDGTTSRQRASDS
jgi:hypothetical protein